jgi:hypothetical protein
MKSPSSYQFVSDYASEQKAKQLNSQCFSSIDKKALQTNLLQYGDSHLCELIAQRPHLFADIGVFVAESSLQKQQQIIAAVEKVIALPAFQQHVLSYAPISAAFIPKARGVFLGYDFHLTPTGSQLIEINTNAGGGLLSALLIASQEKLPTELAALEASFISMFYEEWQAERGQQSLQSIAIVDQHPDSQYLLPEFILFQKLFQQQGIKTVICDPTELSYHNDALWYGNVSIDLIYNRLTDFGLDADAQQALKKAYLANAVVVTPHPRAHALYADKRNLTVLTNRILLQKLGVDSKTIETLIDGIAQTVCVHSSDAETLWARRKQLFFKPTKGYGSKAVYRGDKLTKRVFQEILCNDYVAQTLVLPSERNLNLATHLKFDLRHYVYKGQTLLASSRLYKGQTTNFRTVGGGFAPLVIL